MIICYSPIMLGTCYANTMKTTNSTPRSDEEDEYKLHMGRTTSVSYIVISTVLSIMPVIL